MAAFHFFSFSSLSHMTWFMACLSVLYVHVYASHCRFLILYTSVDRWWERQCCHQDVRGCECVCACTTVSHFLWETAIWLPLAPQRTVGCQGLGTEGEASRTRHEEPAVSTDCWLSCRRNRRQYGMEGEEQREKKCYRTKAYTHMLVRRHAHTRTHTVRVQSLITYSFRPECQEDQVS